MPPPRAAQPLVKPAPPPVWRRASPPRFAATLRFMKNERGFTLIELLVTIAIAAILATLAGPSFLRMIKSNTMSGSVNTFLADLRYARSEAIRRGGRVIMCRSDNPESATPACATAGTTAKGWAAGWIIFHDKDASGAWNSTDHTLRVQSALTGMDAILEGTPTAATAFQFTATGRLQNGAATTLNFGGSQFTADQQRMVCVSPSGRAKISEDGTCT
ncbi:GspH/FimT family pseudopilin [Caenimonas terrae]|uniref:Type II secretion system protein H n=1 Tax=Caenimonas terrae TaxID=696074 RepID=A0ABW0NJY4_9BURK